MTGADAEQTVALAETLGDWPACLVAAIREAAELASPKDRLSCLPFVRGAQRFLTDPSASSPRAPFLFQKALNATAVSCSTPAVLQRLVCDEDPSVRGCLARNPNSPPAILAELAGAEVEAIRKDVAENQATPRHALDQLANDASWVVRYALAGNPTAPASALAHLTHDESWNVRYALAGHPALPAAAFDHLSVDRDTDIRARLVDNTAVPAPLRERLIRELAEDDADWGFTVAEVLAANPSTPSARLIDLGLHYDSTIRWEVTLNPAAPPSIREALLEWLALEKDSAIRLKVARNPQTGAFAHGKLASDPHPDIRRAVGQNPMTPVALLEQLAADPAARRRSVSAYSRIQQRPLTCESGSSRGCQRMRKPRAPWRR